MHLLQHRLFLHEEVDEGVILRDALGNGGAFGQCAEGLRGVYRADGGGKGVAEFFWRACDM